MDTRNVRRSAHTLPRWMTQDEVVCTVPGCKRAVVDGACLLGHKQPQQ